MPHFGCVFRCYFFSSLSLVLLSLGWFNLPPPPVNNLLALIPSRYVLGASAAGCLPPPWCVVCVGVVVMVV